MPSATPFRGYPSKTAYCVAQRLKGMSRLQIARTSGIPQSTVGGCLSAYDIRHGLNEDQRIAREVLTPLALERGLTFAELSHRLLFTIANDQLVDAILDDRWENSQ